MNDFERALPFILRIEGGFSNDPADRGGATKAGVTQETYDRWMRYQDLPSRPVQDITMPEIEKIYELFFWLEARCHELPWPVSLAHFDAAVNHGPSRANHLLQQALGVMADGTLGPITLSAAMRADATLLVREMLWERVEFYHMISKGDQIKFLRGWLARVIQLRKEAA
ncbi:MAG: glycoside hydrolase family 108 protein [Vicinamibacterales bacterium]